MFHFNRSTSNVKKRISKLTISFLLITTVLVMGLPSKAYANHPITAPTQAEVAASITHWANQYNIPPTVLKAVAWAESDWRQFKNGDPLTPLIGFDGVGIGIMQISDYPKGGKTERLSGPNRYQTAVKVADQFASPTTAILAPANDANLVDALAAAPLAGKTSPILLTDNNTLTQATQDKLETMAVTKVYVVGAISPAVFDQVDEMPGVTAISLKGANRIETAAAINAELTSPAGTFVVGYNALADALSVASFAAAHNYSILVTNQSGSLPEGITPKGPVYLVGSDALVDEIAGATRLAGPDRWATNKAVLDTLNFSYDKVYVANGTQGHLVDALVASSLAASFEAPIILTDTKIGGDATAAVVSKKLVTNSVVIALGSEAVVLNSTLGKVIPQTEYVDKLKYDYDFNISEGARILNQKWRTVPKIGDGDRNKLENWYFAVWCYNGWLPRNNPNYAKDHGLVPYQDKVFAFMGKNYNSTITQTYSVTPWDASTLPPSAPPSFHSTWDTPESNHLGDLTINPTLLLSAGGSATEQANGDYWMKFQAETGVGTAIYSLGYYVTGYNDPDISEVDRAIFEAQLISAAKVVTTYGESRLNTAKTLEDVQIALKWFWAVKKLPDLDPPTWQRAQDGYNQALAKTFP